MTNTKKEYSAFAPACQVSKSDAAERGNGGLDNDETDAMLVTKYLFVAISHIIIRKHIYISSQSTLSNNSSIS